MSQTPREHKVVQEQGSEVQCRIMCGPCIPGCLAFEHFDDDAAVGPELYVRTVPYSVGTLDPAARKHCQRSDYGGKPEEEQVQFLNRKMRIVGVLARNQEQNTTMSTGSVLGVVQISGLANIDQQIDAEFMRVDFSDLTETSDQWETVYLHIDDPMQVRLTTNIVKYPANERKKLGVFIPPVRADEGRLSVQLQLNDTFPWI